MLLQDFGCRCERIKYKNNISLCRHNSKITAKQKNYDKDNNTLQTAKNKTKRRKLNIWATPTSQKWDERWCVLYARL